MQVFKTPEQNQDEELLRTVVELFERDKKQSQNQRTVEQVLAELEIPLEYLNKAKAEMMRRQILSENRFASPSRPNQIWVAVAFAAALSFVFVTGAFQLFHNAAPKAAPSQLLVPDVQLRIDDVPQAPPEATEPPKDPTIQEWLNSPPDPGWRTRVSPSK
jgi:hypothetical protein